jgi:TolB-like protein
MVGGRSDGAAVIVLPFDASGADDQTRLFAAGLTQELITDLMRFPDFRLFSPPSSFRQDPNADPVALGRDLGVAYVVRGRVQSAAGIVRLTA